MENNELIAKSAADLPNLIYYVDLAVHMLHLPTHIYDADNRLLLCAVSAQPSAAQPSADPLACDPDFLNRLLHKARQDLVFIESDHGSIVYGGVAFEDKTVLFGPVAIGVPDRELIETHSMRHHCENAYITRGDIPSFASMLIMLYSIHTHKSLSLNEFISHAFLNSSIDVSLDKKISEITALNIDGQPHHPLSMETRVFDCIKQGDPHRLLKNLDAPYPGRRGTLASDTLRSEKNIGIIDVTLGARSAIAGGLNVEEAYTVADAFILEVEDAKTPQEVYTIKNTSLHRFADLVAQVKRRTGANRARHGKLAESQLKLVSGVKNYVARHINEKLTAGSIAEQLNISASYLQCVFKKSEGQSLMRYCRKEKISVAKRLIRDSEYSIAEIADMLNFCSQSHFTQNFRLSEGITPEQYRLKVKINI